MMSFIITMLITIGFFSYIMHKDAPKIAGIFGWGLALILSVHILLTAQTPIQVAEVKPVVAKDAVYLIHVNRISGSSFEIDVVYSFDKIEQCQSSIKNVQYAGVPTGKPSQFKCVENIKS